MNDERVLVLGRAAVERLLGLAEVVTLVRDSYNALARSEARLFPPVREQVDTALFRLRSAYWGESSRRAWRGKRPLIRGVKNRTSAGPSARATGAASTMERQCGYTAGTDWPRNALNYP